MGALSSGQVCEYRPMRPRSTLVVLTALMVWLAVCLIACPQPTAELGLEDPRAAEASGIASPSVFVEAPAVPGPGPILDWTKVDGQLSDLIEGERYRVDYDADHPWIGSTDPLVTIVVFTDYQCPYCKRLDDTLTQLLPQYAHFVRIVWRQYPLAMHHNAELAARYALAAHAQGRFAPMHEWLFVNTRSLSRSSVEAHATAIGLDPRRLHADVDGGWIGERVAKDKQFGRTIRINGTPTFFVNGRVFSGALPEAKLKTIIAEERELAERLIAAGSERREVWARLLAASDPGPIARKRPVKAKAKAKAKHYATQLSGLTPRGASNPKVEILMCGDFDCPFCKRATTTLEALRKAHKNDLAIYFRHQPLPMHKQAIAAHRAAVAADNQGQFWPMFDLLYAQQNLRSTSEIEAMAKQLKLDLKQFRKDIADPKTDALIERQRQFCEQQLDNTGTPGFFINGRPLPGAQPIAAFEAIITEELAKRP